jgi:hypothetical protein
MPPAIGLLVTFDRQMTLTSLGPLEYLKTLKSRSKLSPG